MSKNPPAKKEPVEVLPAPVSDDSINEAVATINNLAREAALDLMLGVGKVIIETCYGGDLEAWKSRGTKDTSYRKLAEHPGLQMSPAGLSRSASVYELDLRLGVSARKQLTATHIRAVVGLPDGEQERLLDEAEERGWSTRKMELEATKVREANKKETKAGRPPLPAYVKSIHKLEKLLDDPDSSFGGLDQVDKLDQDKATSLYNTVKAMRERCEALEKQLAAKVPARRSRSQ